VIVPLFALANAGIEISEEFLVRAASSPITLGIVEGYVVGKPIGIVGTTWLVSRLTRGRLRIPVGLIREVLNADNDPRTVVGEPRARYFGTQLTDTSLTPGPDPRLGPTTFTEWLGSTTGNAARKG
jgi:Na+/H+ antiporter 1